MILALLDTGDLMTIDPGFYLATAITLLAGITWALRLEARVNSADRRFETTEKRFDERFEDLKTNVEYIRDRIDRVLNGNHR